MSDKFPNNLVGCDLDRLVKSVDVATRTEAAARQLGAFTAPVWWREQIGPLLGKKRVTIGYNGARLSDQAYSDAPLSGTVWLNLTCKAADAAVRMWANVYSTDPEVKFRASLNARFNQIEFIGPSALVVCQQVAAGIREALEKQQQQEKQP